MYEIPERDHHASTILITKVKNTYFPDICHFCRFLRDYISILRFLRDFQVSGHPVYWYRRFQHSFNVHWARITLTFVIFWPKMVMPVSCAVRSTSINVFNFNVPSPFTTFGSGFMGSNVTDKWTDGTTTQYGNMQPMCRLCGEEYDTSLHLPGRCSAVVVKCGKQSGKHFLVPNESRQEHWSTLLKTAKTPKG